MRELKFRTYDGGREVMLDNHNFNSIGETGLYKWEGLKWMQFTGLTDKNGVDIYESDVIEVCYNYIGNVVVKFKDGKFNVCDFNIKKCQVIGNIHQDRELLNE